MELDWSKYRNLNRYKKYSSCSSKEFSEVVDKILSYIPSKGDTPKNDSNADNSDVALINNLEKEESNQLQCSKGSLDENKEKVNKIDENLSKEATPLKNLKVNMENMDNENSGSKRKCNKRPNSDINQLNTSYSTDSSESFGSDLIFDMKYCSLQLPIPPEVYQEEDYTLETNTSPSITEYDICYDEEVGSNYVMVEPFRFLSKVHVTFDKESGEQWCCCYFDAKGNYTKKRFNTSHIAFDTAKMLASRCREAAEQSFHNIWILKHKNLLNRPIPENLTESFVLVVNKIKNHLANEQCMVCCVDKIRETLHSAHKHDLT